MVLYKRYILILWLAIVIFVWLYLQLTHTHPITALNKVFDLPYRETLLIGAYLVRPFFLLPSTILNLASGFLLGPLWGFLFAMLGVLLSASVGYWIGHYFGKGFSKRKLQEIKWLKHLQDRTFETILTARLLYLPSDVVNLPAGFLKVNFWMFTTGNFLGSFFTILMGVLVGASFEDNLQSSGLKFNAWYFLISLGLLMISWALSYALRKHRVLVNVT